MNYNYKKYQNVQENNKKYKKLMNFKLPNRPKPAKSHVIFHKKSPPYDFIKMTWATTGEQATSL